ALKKYAIIFFENNATAAITEEELIKLGEDLEQLAAAAGAQVAGEGGFDVGPAGGFGGSLPAEQLAELEQVGFGAAGEGLGLAGVVGGEQGLDFGVVAGEGGFDVGPAGGFGGGEPAEQLAELEQVGFGAAGEGLGFAGVVGGEQGLDFGVVLDGADFFGQLAHVAVRALELEGRLGAVVVGLGRRADVLLVDAGHHVAQRQQLLQHGHVLRDFLGRVGGLEGEAGAVAGFGQAQQRVHVGLAFGHEAGQGGVGHQRVFEVAEQKGGPGVADDVAEVVDVGAVGEHVGDAELLARLGVGVAGHHHGHLAAPEIIGFGAALVHALDFALGIAEGDEFLQKLGVAVLNIIQIYHHVVAHLEGQVELQQLFAGAGVGGLGGVDARDGVADGRAVDFHKNQPQAVGHVFEQGGFAVAGRRDEQQQAHEVGALVGPRRADLLGQVGPDE
nr:hypothetical protein [Tanacetum cinerariifolium]